MVLFSRAFIRKRMISLATTASVTATSLALAQDPPRTHHVRGARSLQYVADRSPGSEEQPFLSENYAAMNKMMLDKTIKPTDDVDRDLVAMTVPHHRGAVDTGVEYAMAMRDAVSDGQSSPGQRRAKLSPADGSAAHGGIRMSQ